ncbi:hypothetical protein MMC18_001630 [Xylographa bjoerkii]|nr:hypothetical protein [Xylographa bjoerkii]
MPLPHGYADYLATNGLYPSKQISTTDAIPAFANETMLAVSAAVALNAFGTLSGMQNHFQAGLSFAHTIHTEGVGTDANHTHCTYQYHNDSSWVTILDFYSDQLLGLDTFPADALAMQSDWYEQQLLPAGTPFAGGLEGFDVNSGIVDWQQFAAATSSVDFQTRIVDVVHELLTSGVVYAPFPTKYFVQGAKAGEAFHADEARSTVGANWALLTMQGREVILREQGVVAKSEL